MLLLDTIGELAGAYRLGNAVFVGGSIAPRGGHNMIEPAAAGLPIVVVANMQNFQAIAQDFLEAEALIQIQSPGELLPAIATLLKNSTHANELGSRARAVVEARRGESRVIAGDLIKLYYAATLKPTRNPAADYLLRPLALLWREGGYLKRKRAETASALLPPLSRPVVSIGGITVVRQNPVYHLFGGTAVGKRIRAGHPYARL